VCLDYRVLRIGLMPANNIRQFHMPTPPEDDNPKEQQLHAAFNQFNRHVTNTNNELVRIRRENRDDNNVLHNAFERSARRKEQLDLTLNSELSNQYAELRSELSQGFDAMEGRLDKLESLLLLETDKDDFI
jgi:ABC-type phosphate transport system auxiliary subunit